ncbi:hypothetical protein BJV78DRAFT_1154573 [Lactifluus subvellereus]|nr:hypothetical protein BJV78DRAFT_1154573 [Lactifluus subvellereus]
MAVPVTQVWYVVDHDFRPILGDAFYVNVTSNGYVYDLQKKTNEKKSPILDHVVADELIVWKLRNSRPPKEIKRKEYLANLKRLDEVPENEGEGDDEAAWLVESSEEIPLHFPEPPPPKNGIHVLVQVPARDMSSLQLQPTPKILDDRPGPDSAPPVSLLYDGFGYFIDAFSRRGNICNLETKRQDLEMAVDSFAEKMTDCYNKEADRMEDGLRALIPYRAHYLHRPSHKQAMERFREVFSSWRVPCLGLTIVGPYITFYAIIFLRQVYYSSARLCPVLTDGRHGTDPEITKDGNRRVLQNTPKELK